MKRLYSFRILLLLISIAGVFSPINADVLFCKADNVNVRAKPDTTAELLGTLSHNDSIVVVDEQGDWFKFDYNEREAWVNKRFFSEGKAQNTETQKYWYNSKSGVLHNSNCRWFGNTKNGFFTDKELGRDCGLCGGALRGKAETEFKYWINTNSNVRHNRGCRWYGNTKHGYYTNEPVGRACGNCGG